MPFAAALSTIPHTTRALDEVCAAVQSALSGAPDLAFLFFSPHHGGAAEQLVQTIQSRLTPRCLLGCVGESIIGGAREIEQEPALSLWVAKWATPVEVTPFHLRLERTSEGLSLLGWPEALMLATPERDVVLALGDPFSFPADHFLTQINEDAPGLRVLGGMASGVQAPGQCRLLMDDAVLDHGAVGLVLQGRVGLRTVVSQGCRPIGRPFVVTRADDNLILELGGKLALTALRELWATLTPAEQEQLRQGPHVGVVINEHREQFQRGDFLIRNLVGMDPHLGALAISDRVRAGQTVQFHVRDAATADEDLRALLQQDRAGHPTAPAAALVFSCNGRGTRLFPTPDHDATAVRAEAGAVPVAGFFAQGELGPVGGRNFLHGYTASVVLFEE
jgi:small ligand-binding sensory domain FIST